MKKKLTILFAVCLTMMCMTACGNTAEQPNKKEGPAIDKFMDSAATSVDRIGKADSASKDKVLTDVDTHSKIDTAYPGSPSTHYTGEKILSEEFKNSHHSKGDYSQHKVNASEMNKIPGTAEAKAELWND